MRVALGVEYNGARYSGWQRQSHVNSVQQEVETALSSNLFCCRPCLVAGNARYRAVWWV